jgi:GTP-sensing pleiotropic transcriptional regulator CodY
MSKKFKKEFKINKTKIEIRQMIDKLIMDLPALRSIVSNLEWRGDFLHFESKIGDGFFQIADQLVIIEIDLNFMGSLAIGQIEEKLDEEMLKLNSRN